MKCVTMGLSKRANKNIGLITNLKKKKLHHPPLINKSTKKKKIMLRPIRSKILSRFHFTNKGNLHNQSLVSQQLFPSDLKSLMKDECGTNILIFIYIQIYFDKYIHWSQYSFIFPRPNKFGYLFLIYYTRKYIQIFICLIDMIANIIEFDCSPKMVKSGEGGIRLFSESSRH